MLPMNAQNTFDLYVQAIDLAKERADLLNLDKMLLNRFKILLRSGAVEDVDRDFAQMGKVRKNTIHSIRELAEGIFEDCVRTLAVSDTDRDRILHEGKERADITEELLFDDLQHRGFILE